MSTGEPETGPGRDGTAWRTTQLPVSRIRPAYQQVANQLRGLIVRGEIAPGDRLPPEPELASMFGVSRSTVREALRTLSSQQLLYTTRGVTGGTFVACPDTDAITRLLTGSLGLLGHDVLSVDRLMETRQLLEIPAARLAARRRNADDLAALVGAAEQETRDPAAEFAPHQHFHTALLDCTHNGLLDVVTAPIFEILETRFLRHDVPESLWEEVRADHAHILDTIQKQDDDQAAASMTEHLHRLHRMYLTIDRTQQ